MAEASVIVLITLMVFGAQYFHNKEIIFPEIAAIACGMLLVDKRSWHVSRIRVWLAIMICAVIGMGVVRYLPLPIIAQMSLGYVIAQLVMYVMQISFAPMISACVLPIMLQSRSVAYLLSAGIMTFLILLCDRLIHGKDEKLVFSNEFTKTNMQDLVLRSLLVAVMIMGAFMMNVKFMAAPPILVAFTEMTHRDHKVRQRFRELVVLSILCIGFACLSRYLLTDTYLTLAALLTIIVDLIVMGYLKFYFPPVAALSVLAMLIPYPAVKVYTFEALASIIIFFACALFFFRKEM